MKASKDRATLILLLKITGPSLFFVIFAWVWILTLAVSSPGLSAADFRNDRSGVKFSKILGGGIAAVISSDVDTRADRLTVVEQGRKTSCHYVSDQGLSFFKDANAEKFSGYAGPLIVSEWTLGLRGEKLVILDPSRGTGCVVASLEYPGPVEYMVKGGRLQITLVHMDNDDDGGKITVSTWKPPSAP